MADGTLRGVAVVPGELSVVEPVADRWLDDLEIGRQIEIARREQRMVPDVEHLAPRRVSRVGAPFGQDRIAHLLERLGNQRRADGARRIARSKCQHPPPPALRHRGLGQKIACKVDDVLQIIGLADAGAHEGNNPVAVVIGKPGRPADTHVQVAIFGQRDVADAKADVCLDQVAAIRIAHEECRMGPGRHRKILDRRRDAAVAFDQKDIRRLQASAQKIGRDHLERHIAVRLFFKISRKCATQRFRDAVHLVAFPRSRSPRRGRPKNTIMNPAPRGSRKREITRG